MKGTRMDSDGKAIPAVSVVVPVGSIDEQLPRQVAAILGQRTSFPFEVVLSLNSAAPEARPTLDAVVREAGDERVRVVPSADRRGAAHARNVAARASRAPRLAFCDADDEVRPGWLTALVQGLDEWDAVTGHVNEVAPTGQETWRPPATPGRLPTFLGVPYVLSGNLGITRTAFEAARGFDEGLTRCEDIALGWTLLSLGFRIGYAPLAVLDYRHRAGLTALMHQHYLYGKGMAEVLSRYPLPSTGASRPLRGLALLRPNGQPTEISVPWFLRRASLAAGRVVGLFVEGRKAKGRAGERGERASR